MESHCCKGDDRIPTDATSGEAEKGQRSRCLPEQTAWSLLHRRNSTWCRTCTPADCPRDWNLLTEVTDDGRGNRHLGRAHPSRLDSERHVGPRDRPPNWTRCVSSTRFPWRVEGGGRHMCVSRCPRSKPLEEGTRDVLSSGVGVRVRVWGFAVDRSLGFSLRTHRRRRRNRCSFATVRRRRLRVWKGELY